VRATDPDIDRNSHIRYSLLGQFADDGTFVVNEHTGEIFATKALDRDPAWKAISSGLQITEVCGGRLIGNSNYWDISRKGWLALDRDPAGGRAIWNFNVLAHDEVNGYRSSLTGYAEVRVMPRDINDNAPVFDQNRLVGRVPEHSRAGAMYDVRYLLTKVSLVGALCQVFGTL